eukprot:12892924-Prorocentrum_lima.AAC.1
MPGVNDEKSDQRAGYEAGMGKGQSSTGGLGWKKRSSCLCTLVFHSWSGKTLQMMCKRNGPKVIWLEDTSHSTHH